MSGCFNLTQLWRSWVAYTWPERFVGFLQGMCMREWVWCACIKKAFLWKEKRRAARPPWEWMMHLFPAHPPSPVSHVIYYIGGWESRALWLPPPSYILTAYPCRGSHWQILADWNGAKRSGSPRFMPGEESLDLKCILERWCGKAVTEGHTGSSKLGTPLSHGKG